MTVTATQIRNFATGGAEDLKSWGGVNIEVDALVAMIENIGSIDKDLEEYLGYELTAFEYNEVPEYGLDTAARDIVCDIFAKTVTGRTWPTHAEGEAANEAFLAALEAAGY